jgi:hypothetical protein
MIPPSSTMVRELLVTTLVGQDLDEKEIRNECILADLCPLALFRSQPRVVASKTGRSFAALR